MCKKRRDPREPSRTCASGAGRAWGQGRHRKAQGRAGRRRAGLRRSRAPAGETTARRRGIPSLATSRATTGCLRILLLSCSLRRVMGAPGGPGPRPRPTALGVNRARSKSAPASVSSEKGMASGTPSGVKLPQRVVAVLRWRDGPALMNLGS
jgi:hypothetical protein